jgi:hypothetical protein
VPSCADARPPGARRIEHDDVRVREAVAAEEAIGGAGLEADVREPGGGGAGGAVGDAAGVLIDGDHRRATRASGRLRLPAPQ